MAVVGYFEPWWVQIIKAVVIFAVMLQLVPLVLIAERKLGDAGRWRDIFTLNRDIVADPDEISPGQVLVLLKR